MAVIVFGGMWLCGLASITSMSRMWFAFGRDGGMPFSNLFYEIHPTLRTPVKSILITGPGGPDLRLWGGLLGGDFDLDHHPVHCL